MYFMAIIKTRFNTDPHIPCGDSKLVDVDGRYSLHNQYQIAMDHLSKRFNSDQLVGIACYKSLRDQYFFSSVKVDYSSLDFSSLTAFDNKQIN